MDRPQPVSAELERNLLNLVSLNRLFGSHRLLRFFLAQWLSPARCYRVLDLATGAGDLPRVMVEWARARDITLRIDAVDANPSTVEIARRHSAGFPEIDFQVANVLTYESAEPYDLVTCSLALHHFAEDDAVRLLRRCRTLSHRFVLVSDLERSLATVAGIAALTALFYREPMTVDDARVSARRAFSYAEFRALAERAAWTDFGHSRFMLCRQAVWLDGRELAEIPVVAEELVESPLPCPAG